MVSIRCKIWDDYTNLVYSHITKTLIHIGQKKRSQSGSAVILQIQDILLPYWLVCTILCLEDYGSGFMADKAVPAARFDGHAAVEGAGGDGHLLGDVAIVIVEILGGTPPKNHHCLCHLAMTMNRQHCPRLKRIEHTLGTILSRGTHIEIHPQSRRLLRLLRQGIQKSFIYLHNQSLKSFLGPPGTLPADGNISS